jgi:ATP-dependent exoDNAse (exonuclease V) beta subunit
MSFTVYKSSAGSGKTFTLVKEYLKMVIPEPEKFHHILAITFTNKAAAEMKERIINSLKECADSISYPDSKTVKFLIPELEKETGLTAEKISSNAQIVLRNILHDYSNFAVSTIDSFVHRIVRTFAFDLHIPVSFEVEMDTDALIVKAVDILISRVGTDEKLTQLLVNFIRTKTDEEKSWKIENDLADVADYLIREDGQTFIEKLKQLSLEDFEEINGQLRNIIKDFENSVKEPAKVACDFIRSRGLDHSAFYRGNAGISKYFEKIESGRFDALVPNSFVETTINDDKWNSSNASPSEIAAIDEIKDELIACFRKISELVKSGYPEYASVKEINKNIYPLAVLNEIEKIISDYKSENDLVLISEFNSRIANVVRNESVPFIYERLGEKYSHFLIDEFQDTSIMQWQNLIPLLENSLATKNFNMVVGDGKQAIYRFRNGEVEQFTSLPQIYNRLEGEIHRQRELALERNYEKKDLKQNFRSKPEIVEFNNDFFKTISAQLPERFAGIYADVIQIPSRKDKGGYVQIIFPNPDEDEKTFEEFNVTEILKTIEEVKGAGFQYKDIAILCRNNNNASRIASELLTQNISVISSESLLLNQSPEVRFLIACIKILLNPLDKIARGEVISYLWISGFLTGDLDTLLRNFDKKDSVLKEENDAMVFYKFTEDHGFNFNPRHLRNMQVYDLMEELIRIFGLNKSVNPHLQFFLDAVLKVSNDKQKEIFDLPDWWEEQKNKLSIVVPAGSDAVRVMTIHKAKGLEFPVVIYPFASERLRVTKNKLWVEVDNVKLPKLKSALVNTTKSLEDTPFASLYHAESEKSFLDLVNLLYVVMTRPTERLYIIASKPAQKDDAAESVPGFFKFYLQSIEVWDENRFEYSFGSKTDKAGKEDVSGEAFELNKIISENWRNRILLSMQAPKNWDIENPDQKQSHGQLIHMILSSIQNEKDVESVLNRLNSEGILSAEEKIVVENEIKNLLSHPEVKPFFKEWIEVRTEAEILLQDGNVLRPDRVLIEGKAATVVDFKTGSPFEKHSDQVKMYMKLLKEMGYEPVKGALIYIGQEEPVVDVG